MLIAAAVCPHPPLLVPEVAQSAAGELGRLRDACDRAIAGLDSNRAEELIVVGGGGRTRLHPASAGGSLAGYGPDITVGEPPAVLPLALTLGAWLLRRSGLRPTRFVEVAREATTRQCRELGRELGRSAPRVAMLVMGDGSARRTERSPGHVDERALDYDTAVASALGAADTAALGALDVGLADELLVAGRPAWQVLAGAADGAALSGDLLAHEAPYGVGYFVALWQPA